MKRHEGLEILQTRVSSVGQQRHQSKVTMTLYEFVRAEWKPNAALALKKSSMRFYGFQLERHIFPAVGSMPLRDINRAQIEACLSNMKRKGHASSTLRNIRVDSGRTGKLMTGQVLRGNRGEPGRTRICNPLIKRPSKDN